MHFFAHTIMIGGFNIGDSACRLPIAKIELRQIKVLYGIFLLRLLSNFEADL